MWAVGSYAGTDGKRHTLTEYYRYNSSNNGWHIVPSPDGGVGDSELAHVWINKAGSVWADGYLTDYFGRKNTLILHWNGETWDQIAGVNVGLESQLIGITASSSLNSVDNTIASVWAVGAYLNDFGSLEQTLIEHITAPTAPPTTNSYYERSIDPNRHYNQGATAAQQGESGVIFLDYGYPANHGTVDDPSYGTVLIKTLYPATIGEIETAVKRFADGYDKYWQGWPQNIAIVVSINNSGPGELTEQHARAWSDMVTRLLNYVVTQGYYEIGVRAGIDAEQSWSLYSRVKPWVTGYMQYPQRVSALYNFGSIDTYPCSDPQHFPPPESCGSHPPNWSDDEYYILSGGAGGALYPIPQVYSPSRSRWWYIVGRRAYDNHEHFLMRFLGNAWGGSLNQQTSWKLLWLELNSDPVLGQTPDWTTVFNFSVLP